MGNRRPCRNLRFHFWAHRIDVDRKIKIEKPFDYVERNFLTGRIFADWHGLNLSKGMV